MRAFPPTAPPKGKVLCSVCGLDYDPWTISECELCGEPVCSPDHTACSVRCEGCNVLVCKSCYFTSRETGFVYCGVDCIRNEEDAG